jgi:hypothetical protein
MKKLIKTINPINGSIDIIWELLKTGKNVDAWFPIITTCRVEGSKRYCTTENGSIEETILTSDNKNKVFRYSFDKQDVFPATNIIGTIKLEAISDTVTNLLWNIEFRLEDESIFLQLKKEIEELYKSAALGLEKLANTNK